MLQINKDQDILPNVTLKLQWHDTKGDTVIATRAMTDMICEKVYAFFGPEGTCHVEAIVAQSRNIPMISYKCSDYKASDVPTFARTEPPDTQEQVKFLKDPKVDDESYNDNIDKMMEIHTFRDEVWGESSLYSFCSLPLNLVLYPYDISANSELLLLDKRRNPTAQLQSQRVKLQEIKISSGTVINFSRGYPDYL
ncbi:hypothetical protein HHI36_007741 [Cryptolaemus montrouzieri]|uniref:Receptor ligand binding region domain-containing protein n=1 Tax=Cryptolaemus montrouzieri TaxID=559131 RepID=A0ABD2MQM9_9CUCU